MGVYQIRTQAFDKAVELDRAPYVSDEIHAARKLQIVHPHAGPARRRLILTPEGVSGAGAVNLHSPAGEGGAKLRQKTPEAHNIGRHH